MPDQTLSATEARKHIADLLTALAKDADISTLRGHFHNRGYPHLDEAALTALRRLISTATVAVTWPNHTTTDYDYDCGICAFVPTVTGTVRATQRGCPVHGYLEPVFGPTRAVLLVDIEQDDEQEATAAGLGSPSGRAQDDRPGCPTCSGPVRETVGMVCRTCGTDYAPAGRAQDGRTGPGEGERTREAARDHDHTTGYPIFAPDAELVVDTVDGPAQWTGAEWNAHVHAATDARNVVLERLIVCPSRVCTTTCPAEQAEG